MRFIEYAPLVIAIVLMALAAFVIYEVMKDNQIYKKFCEENNGTFDGDYFLRNNCLIPKDNYYIKYAIRRDNQEKPILIKT
jgi:hypothetical protein